MPSAKFTFIPIVFLLVATVSLSDQEAKESHKSLSNTIYPTTPHVAWDTTLTVGWGTIFRNPKENDLKGWDSITVENIFGFTKEPKIGDILQFIPLTSLLPVAYSPVTGTVPRDDFDLGSPQWYEVEVKPLEDSAFYNFQAPQGWHNDKYIDILVVHSTDFKCKYIAKQDLPDMSFPAGITIDHIEAALDFDNDGMPEIISCNFCCKDPERVTDCEYSCSSIYLYFENKWHLIYATGMC